SRGRSANRRLVQNALDHRAILATAEAAGPSTRRQPVEAADRLVKLAAIAAKAAVVILQLLQARNGPFSEPASIAFAPDEVAVLTSLNAKLEGKTLLQKNPNPNESLRWAAWIIAKLGGWTAILPPSRLGPSRSKMAFNNSVLSLLGGA